MQQDKEGRGTDMQNFFQPMPYRSEPQEVEHAFAIFQQYPYDYISEYNRMIAALCRRAHMTLETHNESDIYSISYNTYVGQSLETRTRSTAEVLKFVVEYISDPSIQLAISDTIEKRGAIAAQTAEFDYKYADLVKFIIHHRARFPGAIFKFKKALRRGWAAQGLRNDSRNIPNMNSKYYTIQVLDPKPYVSTQQQPFTTPCYTDDALFELYRQNSRLLLGEIETIRASIFENQDTAEALSDHIERILNPTPDIVEIINTMHHMIQDAWCKEKIPDDNRIISKLQGPEYRVEKLENTTMLYQKHHYTLEEWQKLPPRPDFFYYTKKELETVYRDNCVLIQHHLRMIVPHF